MLKSRVILFLVPLFLVFVIPQVSLAEHVKGHHTKKVVKQTTKIAKKSKKVPALKAIDHTKPLGSFELGRYQYCGSDKDCVVATNGCCDCANGGEDVAINKVRLEDFKARFDCNQVTCGFESPKIKCGDGVVTCVEHTCHYVKN